MEFHQRFFEDKTRHNNVLNGLKANGFHIIHNKGGNGQEIAFRKVSGKSGMTATSISEMNPDAKTKIPEM